jgi:TrpR-related protein YerC/YecD
MNKKQLFYQSFLQLKTEDEVKRYLRDLLTIPEINEFAERLYVADMLKSGNTYENIARKTSMSSTTIARVSKWLKNGRDGYSLVLNRLHHHQSSVPRL